MAVRNLETIRRRELIVEKFEKSGLTQAAFCDQHAVSKATLYRALKLGKKSTVQDLGFCEAVVDKSCKDKKPIAQSCIYIKNRNECCIKIPLNTPVTLVEA